MEHNVEFQIALKYRSDPRSVSWNTAYRMHLAGAENMVNDACILHQRVKVHDWKVVIEDVATGSEMLVLAAGSPDGPVDYDEYYKTFLVLHCQPQFRTELTSAGDQPTLQSELF